METKSLIELQVMLTNEKMTSTNLILEMVKKGFTANQALLTKDNMVKDTSKPLEFIKGDYTIKVVYDVIEETDYNQVLKIIDIKGADSLDANENYVLIEETFIDLIPYESRVVKITPIFSEIQKIIIKKCGMPISEPTEDESKTMAIESSGPNYKRFRVFYYSN